MNYKYIYVLMIILGVEAVLCFIIGKYILGCLALSWFIIIINELDYNKLKEEYMRLKNEFSTMERIRKKD